MADLYVDIILPLAVKGRFTYSLPEAMADKVKRGTIVLVPFGGYKLYAGTVMEIKDEKPGFNNIKEVREVLATAPPVNGRQLSLWSWIAGYYMCGEGEVMKAAIPSAFMPNSDKEGGYENRYRPKEEICIALHGEAGEKRLNEIIEKLSVAPKQRKLLIDYLGLSGIADGKERSDVPRSVLLDHSGVSSAVLTGLVKKKILECYSRPVSRLSVNEVEVSSPNPLSPAQNNALEGIKNGFEVNDVVLLRGVTSSGKTEIYVHLIEEQLRKGKQVLYMLPEIALTTQIINRLRRYFGSAVGIYHSRFNDAERVEIWRNCTGAKGGQGYGLILGVRSSIFLPFDNLGLIIVDEEHDSSYKQQDPAPRYNARDTAVILASLHKAKVLLGSASPSIESYSNALSGKYGLVELNERFGAIKLPEMVIADTREAYRKKMMVSHFAPELLSAIDSALAKGEQIILFRNRRGFAPYVECTECGWIPQCDRCSVSLTYHKGENRLVCHYCGNSVRVPSRCGNCESTSIKTKGFGTEKIEDEIRILFPDAVVGRMDQDTTRGKFSFDRIIGEFERGKIDILTGTQMISKGLDFENLTVVGILNADNLMNFPDFRAHERSYQLIEQVSGRAGRRLKQGQVIIQTTDPKNRILRLLMNHDYKRMVAMQMEERKAFGYPPFRKMVRINLKHRDRVTLDQLSVHLASRLRENFGNRILGPEYPLVFRVQLWYIKTVLVKLEAGRELAKSKDVINCHLDGLVKLSGGTTLKISVDVDPY